METLKAATKELRKALEDTLGDAERLRTSINIVEICKFYKEVYENHKLLDELVKLLGDVKEEYKKKIIPPLFQGMEVDSIKTSGRQFILNAEFYASIPADKMPKGEQWLIDNGYEALIKKGVNAQTLTAAVKDWIKDKGELPPEDVMTIHQGYYISMRKA